MAFNQDDIYLTSGTGQLINNWVDPVYKYDSSSFYNWEQDNLPLYDLEDRDDYLHEMAGYPASASVPSIMLTVSDCGIDNKKVFGSVSGALQALPNTLRHPYIIEVCVSGELGDLRLENKEIVASGGGLEIINRGFAKVMCGSAAGQAVSASVFAADTDTSSIATFSSIDTSNAVTDAFAVGSQARVGNKHATPFNFFSEFNRTFVQPPEWAVASDATPTRTVVLSTSFNDSGSLSPVFTTTTDEFAVSVYEDNSASSDIVLQNHGNITSPRDNTRANITVGTSSRVTGFIYANALSTLTVKNCSGKIFIRGFCVDGATQAVITSTGSQRTDIGYDIDGSDVVIENCTVTRCKKVGLQVNNSNVTLNRGFIAVNNYELEAGVGGTFLAQKKTNVLTPGMRATNSNITLSSALTSTYGSPIDSPFSFSRNMVGIELKNSQLVTPPSYRYGLQVDGTSITELHGSETIVLQTFLNLHEGILAKQSLIELGSRISSFQNKVGVRLIDSTCKVQEATIDHNQEGGLVALGSTFNYNKNAQIITRVGPFNPPTRFKANGQHVHLDGSQFVPTDTSGMDLIYDRIMFSGNHQTVQTAGGYANTTLPAVEVTNGSYMKAVSPTSFGLVSIDDSTKANYYAPTKGAAFSVTKNSSLDIIGTESFATYVMGPFFYKKQQRITGLYAGQNSTIHISGPTTIAQFGIDALAEDGSTVKIAPQETGGVIDVSGWGLLNPLNHTRVQLHSTRACLVANNNSNILMEDLGDYHGNWDTKYGGVGTHDYPTDGNNNVFGRFYTKEFCSSGSLQFYPNPLANYAYAGKPIIDLVDQSTYPTVGGAITTDTNPFTTLPYTDIGGGSNAVSSISYGGMCVRALGGSTVKAKNVSFPTGWTNTSGPYYDASTVGGCDLLRIWNISDGSKLHASYLSVGNDSAHAGVGLSHPQDLSGFYYGPSALWTSDTGTGLSGAPSGTADTSTASVLDSFGLGIETNGELGYYGETSHKNVGPFRIYVSVDPKANFLGYPYANGTYTPPLLPSEAFISMGYNFPDTATLITGPPKQLFAQGYATSGDCSAINNVGDTFLNASAIYQDLGFSGYVELQPVAQQTENTASSFYYTSSMVTGNPQANIWLDESAMNTFANAKNGTLGTSGRKKLFSYYRAILAETGEGSPYSAKGAGIGSINLFDLDRYL
tara:strand:+ start:21072 stop:24611 length:3540 start_codon:yes stop_codon:yes gene_type:complete